MIAQGAHPNYIQAHLGHASIQRTLDCYGLSFAKTVSASLGGRLCSSDGSERFNGSYSGTKAYLLNLSLRLQQEVASKGVRIQVVLPGATRTAIWEKAGTDIATLPASILMDVDEMVGAALVGLDRGETVTIPSLPDIADWEAYEAARQNMIPKLSLSSPALRYGVAIA